MSDSPTTVSESATPETAAKKASRSRTVLATGFWFVGNFVITFAQQLAVVPLFLKYWQAPTYGDWTTLTAMTVWFSMADAGMQSFVTNRLTQHHSRGHWDEFRSDLASATLMYVVVISSAFLLLLGLAFGYFVHAKFYGDHRPLADSAVMIIVFMGTYILMMILSGFVTGLYRAMGQANKSPRVAFFHRSLLLINTILILVLGGTPRNLATVYLVQSILVTTYVAWDVRRLDRRAVPTLRGARWSVAVSFLAPSVMFLLLDTGRNLTVQGMTLVVSGILGPVAVVGFTTTRTLANALRQLTSMIGNTVWPELTRISARGENDRMVLGHNMIVKWTSLMSLVPAAILFFSGTDVYAAWTRGRSVADEHLLRLFLLDVLIGTPAMASTVILQATSEVQTIAIFQSVAGVINVIACFVGIHYLGLPGAAIAPLLLTMLLFGTWVPAHVQKQLQRPALAYWTGIYLPLVLISLATFCVGGLTHHYVARGLQGVAIETVTISLCAVGLAVPFLFTTEERTFFSTIARRVLKRA